MSAIQTLTRQLHLHQKPPCVAGFGLFTAPSSLLEVWELSSACTSLTKMMSAPAFSPAIPLKIHKTGLACEPEPESVGAALGCVFKRPRRRAASRGWKWLFASVCLPSHQRNPFIGLICKGAPEGLFSNVFQGVCPDVLISDSDRARGPGKRVGTYAPIREAEEGAHPGRQTRGRCLQPPASESRPPL